MEVGKPQRVHRVEPLREPVPRKLPSEPAAPRREPATVK
jgi:hypothetical protein